MDWINSVQRAVDYIENHLCEPTDYEKLAKEACSSVFHFQRVFSIVCGYTVGDYIRMRRLSMAGSELASGDKRVIDIAFKYGYNSPESFSRAFTKFHGISPSQVKHGKSEVKSFSPLSLKLILKGGNIVNYRIEKTDSFQFICKKLKVPSGTEINSDTISLFWKECDNDGTISGLVKYMPENSYFGKCISGATFGTDISDSSYAIGVCYNGEKITDSHLTVEIIPPHTYIVFPCVGKMPEAFSELYHKIYSDFAGDYKPSSGTDFEVYPSADVKNDNYKCEIWIAAEKK